MDQGGRLSGRSEMSLTFDTIRLRNGQTYRFAGR
jgi:azurin